MLNKRKRKTKLAKTITDLVPSIFALAVAGVGVEIMTSSLGKVFGEEVKQRMMEFKLMGVIEIEKRDKGKKTIIEYRKLRGIKKYVKNFLRRNPKWKSEEENLFGIKTGRIILTRIYRRYNQLRAWEEEHICPECGRSYDDD